MRTSNTSPGMGSVSDDVDAMLDSRITVIRNKKATSEYRFYG